MWEAVTILASQAPQARAACLERTTRRPLLVRLVLLTGHWARESPLIPKMIMRFAAPQGA